MSSQKHKETHVLDNTETIWKHFNIHKRKKKTQFTWASITENTAKFQKTQHFRKHNNFSQDKRIFRNVVS